MAETVCVCVTRGYPRHIDWKPPGEHPAMGLRPSDAINAFLASYEHFVADGIDCYLVPRGDASRIPVVDTPLWREHLKRVTNG